MIFLIGDVHYAQKYAETGELDHHEKEVEEQVKRLGTGCTVVYLGDLFDSVYSRDIHQMKRRLFQFVVGRIVPIVKNVVILVGNHDMEPKFLRGIIAEESSPLPLLFQREEKVSVVWKPEVITIEGENFLAVPYLPRNAFTKTVLNFISPEQLGTIKACFAHQEFRGSCYSGTGEEADEYNFDFPCYSGHIHTPLKVGRVTYIGEAFMHHYEVGPSRRRFGVLNKSCEFVPSRSVHKVSVPYIWFQDAPLRTSTTVLENVARAKEEVCKQLAIHGDNCNLKLRVDIHKTLIAARRRSPTKIPDPLEQFEMLLKAQLAEYIPAGEIIVEFRSLTPENQDGSSLCGVLISTQPTFGGYGYVAQFEADVGKWEKDTKYIQDQFLKMARENFMGQLTSEFAAFKKNIAAVYKPHKH